MAWAGPVEEEVRERARVQNRVITSRSAQLITVLPSRMLTPQSYHHTTTTCAARSPMGVALLVGLSGVREERPRLVWIWWLLRGARASVRWPLPTRVRGR